MLAGLDTGDGLDLAPACRMPVGWLVGRVGSVVLVGGNPEIVGLKSQAAARTKTNDRNLDSTCKSADR